MTPVTLEGVVSVVTSLATAAFWYYINTISKRMSDADKDRQALREMVHRVEKEYQTRTDALSQKKDILDLLKEIKDNLKEVSHKLDRKADKS